MSKVTLQDHCPMPNDKWSNGQMVKWPNGQMVKWSNGQMVKRSSNTQMLKCSNAQMLNCQMLKCHMLKCSNAQNAQTHTTAQMPIPTAAHQPTKPTNQPVSPSSYRMSYVTSEAETSSLSESLVRFARPSPASPPAGNRNTMRLEPDPGGTT